MIYQDATRGAYLTREFADGRVADVVPLTFDRARLLISRDLLAETYDDGW